MSGFYQFFRTFYMNSAPAMFNIHIFITTLDSLLDIDVPTVDEVKDANGMNILDYNTPVLVDPSYDISLKCSYIANTVANIKWYKVGN